MNTKLDARWRALLPLAATLALGGCAASTVAVRPCCYDGRVTVTSVDRLVLTTEQGDRRRFREVFPGYEPDTGLLTRPLAFDEADIALVVYPGARRVLGEYDANGNGVMEPPELTVLYIREAARGLGTPIETVSASPPTGAVMLSQAERGGLTRYVARRLGDMTPAARRLFEELEMIGRDIRTDSDGPDPEMRFLPGG